MPGRLLLGLLLACPAPVSSSVELAFDDVFEHKVRLAAESGVGAWVGGWGSRGGGRGGSCGLSSGDRLYAV